MHIIHAIANCIDCNWEKDSRNSMVLAAQHHRKTGHYVQVEQCYGHSFGERDDKESIN